MLPHHFQPEEVTTTGSFTAGGQRVAYHAVAGTLVVHAKGWDDVSQRVDLEPEKTKGEEGKPVVKMTTAEASMFYVAYFKDGAPSATRPITFLYNGGPGSPTVWLHMGAFGPRAGRDPRRSAPPVGAVHAREQRVEPPRRERPRFHRRARRRLQPDRRTREGEVVLRGGRRRARVLGVHHRSSSESTGAGTRPSTSSARATARPAPRSSSPISSSSSSIDFNGVILLSQILNFAFYPDGADTDPGQDISYELALPTYAATAWYHHKLGADVPADLKALVAEVEHFAVTEYALALQQGAALPEADRAAIAAKLHKYTSLPVDYLRKAKLRVTAGEFAKALEDPAEMSTGRLDSRFTGPAMDPLQKEADYDPFDAATGSAYVSAFNDYVRKDLKFGDGRTFHTYAEGAEHWSFEHHSPAGDKWFGALNVMGDLAVAMKYNPNLKRAAERGVLRSRDALLPGRLRNAAPSDPRRSPGEHRIQALRVGAHGLRGGVAAPRAARQRGRLHSADVGEAAREQRQGQVGLGGYVTRPGDNHLCGFHERFFTRDSDAMGPRVLVRDRPCSARRRQSKLPMAWRLLRSEQ